MINLNEIEIEKLPKKRRLIIQFALDFPNKVVLMRMEELAMHLNVDPSTVVKACKGIGLKGFHELKEILKKEVHLTRIDSVFSGMIKDIEDHPDAYKIAQEALLGDIMLLQKTYESQSMATLSEVASGILSATKTYVIGLGHVGIVAKYFERLFRAILPNVHANTEYHGELYSNMAHFTDQDLVIAIGLDKCPRQTLSAIKYAKSVKVATTVCIVDSIHSPLIQECDHKLIINNSNALYFGSMIGAFSLGNALFHTMASMQKERTVAHFQFFRKMASKDKNYV